jgi:aspartate/methionine/tyrosine aminotransferase
MEIILRNKAKWIAFIEKKYSGWFEWTRPNAGAIAFVKCKVPYTSSERLGKQLAEVGISIKPAYCFSDNMVRTATSDNALDEVENYFRIGFGERKMALVLDALEKFVQANEATWRRNQGASNVG